MTADEYRTTLAELGLNPYSAGPVLGISRRQSRRYAYGDSAVPPRVELHLLALLSLSKD
jgi:hypothetical protein